MDCDPPQSIISIQQQSQPTSITLTPSSSISTSGGQTSVSLNVINQRYLQHQHIHNNRGNNRFPPQLMIGVGGNGTSNITIPVHSITTVPGSSQKANLLSNSYAPASLPLDLMTNNGNSSLNDHHLNSSASLVIGGANISNYPHHYSNIIQTAPSSASGLYVPFDGSMMSHHPSVALVNSTSVSLTKSNNSRNPNNNSNNVTSSNNNNNNTTNQDRDESPMVGVCVQSPVVIH